MLTPAWTPFRPHEKQVAAWKTPRRFVSLACGRGSGKTELAKRRLVRFLPVRKEHSDPRYFYGGPTHDQAKRVAWDSLLQLIPDDWILGTPNIAELKIKTVFGSELYVIGLDKPQRIEGVQWDGCVLDESCDLKPGTFDKNVLPALTWRNGWCWRIGVPKRQGPSCKEFKDFHNSAMAGEREDAIGYTWPSSDILPEETLYYAREHMDAKDYNEQMNAVFETASGGVFHSFDRNYNIRPCSYERGRAIIVGSDFNVDPMCWCFGHQIDDHMEWFDELWQRNINTAEALEIVCGRYSTHTAGFEFYGDATGRARKTAASETDYIQIENHEGLKKLGRTVHYPRSNPHITDKFAAATAMFCNANNKRRMFIDPRCKHLIDDCEDRAYKPGTREPADVGDIGHMTDAMCYAVYALFPLVYEDVTEYKVFITPVGAM